MVMARAKTRSKRSTRASGRAKSAKRTTKRSTKKATSKKSTKKAVKKTTKKKVSSKAPSQEKLLLDQLKIIERHTQEYLHATMQLARHHPKMLGKLSKRMEKVASDYDALEKEVRKLSKKR